MPANRGWCRGLGRIAGGQNGGVFGQGVAVEGGQVGEPGLEGGKTSLGHLGLILPLSWHYNGLLRFALAIALAQI